MLVYQGSQRVYSHEDQTCSQEMFEAGGSWSQILVRKICNSQFWVAGRLVWGPPHRNCQPRTHRPAVPGWSSDDHPKMELKKTFKNDLILTQNPFLGWMITVPKRNLEIWSSKMTCFPICSAQFSAQFLATRAQPWSRKWCQLADLAARGRGPQSPKVDDFGVSLYHIYIYLKSLKMTWRNAMVPHHVPGSMDWSLVACRPVTKRPYLRRKMAVQLDRNWWRLTKKESSKFSSTHFQNLDQTEITAESPVIRNNCW